MKQQISGTADELADEIGEMREITQKLAEQERQKKVERLKRRVVGRFRNNVSSKAFHAWQKHTAERLRGKILVKRAIGRFRNLCMGHAFNRWAGAVRSARKRRQDALLEEQAEQIQQMMSRLDPNGAGLLRATLLALLSNDLLITLGRDYTTFCMH